MTPLPPGVRHIATIPPWAGEVVGMQVLNERLFVATTLGVFVLVHEVEKDSYRLRPVGFDRR